MSGGARNPSDSRLGVARIPAHRHEFSIPIQAFIPLGDLAPALRDLLRVDLSYAPGVNPADPDTWTEHSHFTPADYAADEGLPDWSRAASHPHEVQYLRAYLVLPTPNQQCRRGGDSDFEAMARMIVNVAQSGIQEPIEVRPGEDGYVMASSGHRRRYAGVNAAQKFLPCRLNPEAADQLLAAERIILGNDFRLEVNAVDKALAYVDFITQGTASSAARQSERSFTMRCASANSSAGLSRGIEPI